MPLVPSRARLRHVGLEQFDAAPVTRAADDQVDVAGVGDIGEAEGAVIFDLRYCDERNRNGKAVGEIGRRRSPGVAVSCWAIASAMSRTLGVELMPRGPEFPSVLQQQRRRRERRVAPGLPPTSRPAHGLSTRAVLLGDLLLSRSGPRKRLHEPGEVGAVRSPLACCAPWPVGSPSASCRRSASVRGPPDAHKLLIDIAPSNVACCRSAQRGCEAPDHRRRVSRDCAVEAYPTTATYGGQLEMLSHLSGCAKTRPPTTCRTISCPPTPRRCQVANICHIVSRETTRQRRQGHSDRSS
jgi:hypothetical protein